MLMWRNVAVALSLSVAAGSAEAAISYSLYDDTAGGALVLSFETETLLSPAAESRSQVLTNIGGSHAHWVAGGSMDYRQGPPGFQPTYFLSRTTDLGQITLSVVFQAPDFPYRDESNGVPGNGTFAVTGSLYLFPDDPFQPLTSLAQLRNIVIAGVPETNVPEPASLALLGAGLLGLVALRRRNDA